MPRARQYGPQDSKRRRTARKTSRRAAKKYDKWATKVQSGRLTENELARMALGVAYDGRINAKEFPVWMAARQILPSDNKVYARAKAKINRGAASNKARRVYKPYRAGEARLTRQEFNEIFGNVLH